MLVQGRASGADGAAAGSDAADDANATAGGDAADAAATGFAGAAASCAAGPAAAAGDGSIGFRIGSGMGANSIRTLTSICPRTYTSLCQALQQQPGAGGGGRHPADPGHLPHGWQQAIDPGSGRSFYYNSVTGASQWDAPL